VEDAVPLTAAEGAESSPMPVSRQYSSIISSLGAPPNRILDRESAARYAARFSRDHTHSATVGIPACTSSTSFAATSISGLHGQGSPLMTIWAAASAGNKFREVARTSENPTSELLAEGLTHLSEAVGELHQELQSIESKVKARSDE
jgi:hypothetical protein